LVRIQAEHFGIVAEQADATDLKSVDQLIVWVRFPPFPLEMTNNSMDIVESLRNVLHNDRSVELMNRAAANEIESLRNEIKFWEERFNEVCTERDEFWGMFDKARKERDEARREVCQIKGTVRWNHYFPHFDPKGYAENRGWDCHKDYK
jgi:chromosome segregation ATPase